MGILGVMTNSRRPDRSGSISPKKGEKNAWVLRAPRQPDGKQPSRVFRGTIREANTALQQFLAELGQQLPEDATRDVLHAPKPITLTLSPVRPSVV